MSEIGSITFLVSLLDVHYEIHRPLVWSIIKRVVGVLGPNAYYLMRKIDVKSITCGVSATEKAIGC